MVKWLQKCIKMHLPHPKRNDSRWGLTSFGGHCLNPCKLKNCSLRKNLKLNRRKSKTFKRYQSKGYCYKLFVDCTDAFKTMNMLAGTCRFHGAALGFFFVFLCFKCSDIGRNLLWYTLLGRLTIVMANVLCF